MTTTDERAVSADDIAESHLKMLRILGGFLLNPLLPQPRDWQQIMWPWGPELTGYFHNDDANLDTRRMQVRCYAAAFGLTMNDERPQGEDGIRVRAVGEYQGVKLTVWGLAPQDGSAA